MSLLDEASSKDLTRKVFCEKLLLLCGPESSDPIVVELDDRVERKRSDYRESLNLNRSRRGERDKIFLESSEFKERFIRIMSETHERLKTLGEPRSSVRKEQASKLWRSMTPGVACHLEKDCSEEEFAEFVMGLNH